MWLVLDDLDGIFVDWRHVCLPSGSSWSRFCSTGGQFAFDASELAPHVLASADPVLYVRVELRGGGSVAVCIGDSVVPASPDGLLLVLIVVLEEWWSGVVGTRTE